MNLHRLTISNLEHIVETCKDSQDEAQILLYAAAVIELNRRKTILGLNKTCKVS